MKQESIIKKAIALFERRQEKPQSRTEKRHVPKWRSVGRVKGKKLKIRVISYLAIGRCMFCKGWFSRERCGVDLRAGKHYEVLCLPCAHELVARYGQELR